MPNWTADEEDECILKHARAIEALCEQFDVRLPHLLVAALAATPALAYLHHRETRRALAYAVLREKRRYARLSRAYEAASKRLVALGEHPPTCGDEK